ARRDGLPELAERGGARFRLSRHRWVGVSRWERHGRAERAGADSAPGPATSVSLSSDRHATLRAWDVSGFAHAAAPFEVRLSVRVQLLRRRQYGEWAVAASVGGPRGRRCADVREGVGRERDRIL